MYVSSRVCLCYILSLERTHFCVGFRHNQFKTKSPSRFLRILTGISPNKRKHSLIANSYHGTMLPTKMVHHRDKTSRAMANRCWCLITSFCCRIFCLLIYLLLLFVYFSLVCCCYCCCFSCFLCFLLLPSFKQALHNKLPTHLGGNYSRIVFQPTDNCHNRDCGTSDN